MATNHLKRKLDADTANENAGSEARRRKSMPGTSKSIENVMINRNDEFQFIEDYTEVNNGAKLNESLALLQREGATIKRLIIYYTLSDIQPLLDAIVENCGENLHELEWHYTDGTDNRYSKKFRAGINDFVEFLPKCSACFPNLRGLKVMYDVAPINPHIRMLWDHIAINFPALISLTVENYPKFPIERFCEMNPQLEILVLDNTPKWQLKSELLESIDSKLPNLKRLRIVFRPYAYKDDYGRPRFENLEVLSAICKWKSYDEVLDFVNLKGDNIEVLGLATQGVVHSSTIERIAEYKKLKKLYFGARLTDENLNDLAERIPNIEELELSADKVTFNAISEVYKKCPNFNKLFIRFGSGEENTGKMMDFCKNVDTQKIEYQPDEPFLLLRRKQ